MFSLTLALLLSSPGAAEPLSDKIGRDYLEPALAQVQGALEGRQPNWTPPVLPGTAQTAKLRERVRALWLEPLMGAGRSYAFAAASSLASPRAFEAPAEPDLSALLPDATISPAAEALVSTVERRFLSRLFPENYASAASGGLGSGLADEDRDPLPPAGSRLARADDFTSRRGVADSTSLTRGSAGAGARLKLKPFASSLATDPDR